MDLVVCQKCTVYKISISDIRPWTTTSCSSLFLIHLYPRRLSFNLETFDFSWPLDIASLLCSLGMLPILDSTTHHFSHSLARVLNSLLHCLSFLNLLPGKTQPCSPCLTSSSTLAHGLVKRAMKITHRFTPLPPIYDLRLNWVLSAVWKSFGLLQPNPTSKQQKPNLRAFFISLKRSPTTSFLTEDLFLLFHKENGNHKEEVPDFLPPALQTFLHLHFPSSFYKRQGPCCLRLCPRAQEQCSTKGPPYLATPFVLALSQQHLQAPLQKQHEMKSNWCPHVFLIPATISLPYHSQTFEVTPFPHLNPLTSGFPPCYPLKPLTEVTNNFLLAKSRGQLSICLILTLLASRDWYLRLQWLPSPIVAGFPFLLDCLSSSPLQTPLLLLSFIPRSSKKCLPWASFLTAALSRDLVCLPFTDDSHTYVSSQTSLLSSTFVHPSNQPTLPLRDLFFPTHLHSILCKT